MDENKEKQAADTILEHGISFVVKRGGILGLFSKNKTYTIQPPTMGCLLEIAKLNMLVSIDETRVAEEPLAESWKIINDSNDVVARVIATAILAKKWKIRIFRGMLTRRLMWQLTTKQALNAVSLVVYASNPGNFLNSIRYIKTTATMTKPKMDLSPQEHGG